MTTSSTVGSISQETFEGKIFGPTLLSNSSGDTVEFTPQASITPIEAVRIAELFSLYTISTHSNIELNFVVFIAEHRLYEHFVLTELREDCCHPTVDSNLYYCGKKLIDLASHEFIKEYNTD